MPSTLIQSLECGLDFIAFLGDRVSITSKKELRDIYNAEFKGRYGPKQVSSVNLKPELKTFKTLVHREGIKDSSFYSVIYALLKFNKAHTKQGKIYIDAKPQVRHCHFSMSLRLFATL